MHRLSDESRMVVSKPVSGGMACFAFFESFSWILPKPACGDWLPVPSSPMPNARRNWTGSLRGRVQPPTVPCCGRPFWIPFFRFPWSSGPFSPTYRYALLYPQGPTGAATRAAERLVPVRLGFLGNPPGPGGALSFPSSVVFSGRWRSTPGAFRPVVRSVRAVLPNRRCSGGASRRCALPRLLARSSRRHTIGQPATVPFSVPIPRLLRPFLRHSSDQTRRVPVLWCRRLPCSAPRRLSSRRGLHIVSKTPRQAT